METLISGIDGTLTTVAFVPQALQVIKRKETKAISLLMYLAFATGVAFWLTFGVMIGNWPMMAANSITLALAVTIIGMKLRYG